MRSSIPRPVRLLGLTSFFTDAATEMIYPLLPVFLSRVLGAGALSLGLIEGIAEAVNSVLKIASGYLSDRTRRRRRIVIGGYAISSLARPLIAFAATWPQVLIVRALDRTGKGIRGAPRDAMLAQFADVRTRGRIYGFHRAMDHAGAIAGPLVASGILLLAPGEYRLVFALTAIPGAIAVALLFLVPETDGGSGVPNPPAQRTDSASHEAFPGDARTRGSSSAPPARTAVDPPNAISATERVPRRLLAFLGILLVFTLGNSSDAFLLLRLSDAIGGVTYIPLLWAGLHLVKASLSTWGGMLSDRLGRKRVIVMGWVVYAVVYLGFATADTPQLLVMWFLLYGTYFALAEGAEKALVADLTPVVRHGVGFGLYNATVGFGALAASVGFGFLYERFGAAVAFGAGSALAMAAALFLLALRLPELEPSRSPGA